MNQAWEGTLPAKCRAIGICPFLYVLLVGVETNHEVNTSSTFCTGNVLDYGRLDFEKNENPCGHLCR